MPAHGLLGKLPPKPDAPKLQFSTLLRAAASAVPDVIDFATGIDSWPMYGNNRVGDCVEAGSLHALIAQTFFGQGSAYVAPDERGITLYEAWTGYNPNDPNSDRGTVIQEALGLWRKSGIDGHKIVAFASVDFRNPNEVAAALYYFGHLLIGFEVPSSAMQQFDAGQPWDVVQNPGQIEGGHCVNVAKLDQAHSPNLTVVTWAALQGMTAAFWDKYVDEAWVLVTRDWVNLASGLTPTGMDLAAFGREFASLTGEANPFPEPEPGPTPEPPGPDPQPPSPTPGPVTPDAADEALAPILKRKLAHPWARIHEADRQTFQAWLSDKGL